MKLDNKGFVVSTLMYTLLIVFLFLIIGIITLLSNRKMILDKLKKDVKNELNGMTKYDYYPNGTVIYYNPVTNKICSDYEEDNSLNENKTGCMKWYTFNDSVNSNKVNMILDHNTTYKVAYNSEGTNSEPKEAKEELDKLVDEFKWKVTPRLITADEIAHIVGADRDDTIKWSSGKPYGTTIDTQSGWYYFDGSGTTYSTSNGWQKNVVNSTNKSKYVWLYDYTKNCVNSGCNNQDSNTNGYWTNSAVVNSSNLWYVYAGGIDGHSNYGGANNINYFGVRPVITVDKKKINLNNQSLTKYIINLEKNKKNELVYDGTDDNNLRYVGSNPDNYVYFNNELWRIIGVMNNVEDDRGNKSSYVKIVRSESIGNYSFDSCESGINNSNGINQWGKTTYVNGSIYKGADLMQELNTDYLGNITIGTDGKWYSADNNTKNNLMPSTKLNTNAINMIEKVKWNLGAGNDGSNDSSSITAKIAYKNEKLNNPHAINNGKYCETSATDSNGIYYCNDNVKRTTSWIGQVGLISLSDYGFASKCFKNNVNLSNYNECSDDNYLLDKNNNMHTLTPAARDKIAMTVFRISSDGSVPYYNNASNAFAIYPTVYLKSDVMMDYGVGTVDSPYHITIK